MSPESTLCSGKAAVGLAQASARLTSIHSLDAVFPLPFVRKRCQAPRSL